MILRSENFSRLAWTLSREHAFTRAPYPANLREKVEKVKKCKRKGLEKGIRFVNAFRNASVMRWICCFSVVSETYLKVYPRILYIFFPVLKTFRHITGILLDIITFSIFSLLFKKRYIFLYLFLFSTIKNTWFLKLL